MGKHSLEEDLRLMDKKWPFRIVSGRTATQIIYLSAKGGSYSRKLLLSLKKTCQYKKGNYWKKYSLRLRNRSCPEKEHSLIWTLMDHHLDWRRILRDFMISYSK